MSVPDFQGSIWIGSHFLTVFIDFIYYEMMCFFDIFEHDSSKSFRHGVEGIADFVFLFSVFWD